MQEINRTPLPHGIKCFHENPCLRFRPDAWVYFQTTKEQKVWWLQTFRNKTTQTKQSEPGHEPSQISSPRWIHLWVFPPYCHPKLPAAHPVPLPHPEDAEPIQANQALATMHLQDLLDPPWAAQGSGPWHTGKMDLAQTQPLPKRRKAANSQADWPHFPTYWQEQHSCPIHSVQPLPAEHF